MINLSQNEQDVLYSLRSAQRTLKVIIAEASNMDKLQSLTPIANVIENLEYLQHKLQMIEKKIMHVPGEYHEGAE